MHIIIHNWAEHCLSRGLQCGPPPRVWGKQITGDEGITHLHERVYAKSRFPRGSMIGFRQKLDGNHTRHLADVTPLPTSGDAGSKILIVLA